MAEETHSRGERFLEVFTAVLLGLTTILGALAAYYESKWSGSSNENFVKSIVSQQEANSGYLALFNRQTDIKLERIGDDIYYTEYKRAIWNKDPDTTYFFSKLTPQSQADILKGNSDLPTTEVYKKAKEDTALIEQVLFSSDSAMKVSQAQMISAQKEGESGDDFMLITVLYTIVLFFAGFSSLKISMRMKWVYMIVAVVVFASTTVLFCLLPFPA